MRFENAELRAFRAVVEAGGFSRAAQLLSLSQSAVSQAVAGLEAKLETPLLERGRQQRLTAAGRRLFRYADDVLRAEQSVIDDLAGIKRGREQQLRVALSASINRFHAPELISAYYRQNPESVINVAEMPSRNIVQAVLSEHVELGLGPFQRGMEAFTTVPLYSDTRHLVASPSHPRFDALREGDASALRSTALITSALDNPDLRPAIQRIRDQFSSVWEVSSLSLRVHMIEQGMGVAFMDAQVLEQYPPCSTFCILGSLEFGEIRKQVGLYSRKDRVLSRGASAFVELCRAHWSV